ncbi:MAG: pre-toxin TG domain-containing protein [Bdellovibrionales bacterium]|nr:pre-toxin TG domain-containing protein [Bdellovibrionales bacterium]
MKFKIIPLVLLAFISGSVISAPQVVRTCAQVGAEFGQFICTEISLPDFSQIFPPIAINPTLPNSYFAPDLRTILPQAIPGFDGSQFDNIRSFQDLQNIQNRLVTNLPSIMDSFVNQFMKSSIEIPDMNRFRLPTASDSGLMAVIPQTPSSDEVIRMAKDHLRSRGTPLNMDSGNHIQAMSTLFFRLLKSERPIFENYVRMQNEINDKLVAVATAKTSQTSRELMTVRLDEQSVIIGGEVLAREEVGAYGSRPRDPSLQHAYDKLASIRDTSPQASYAASKGLQLLNYADLAYAAGDRELGDFYRSMALTLADIGIGFIPVIGQAQAVYEFTVGKSALTGDELSSGERAIALIGIIPAGGKVAKIIGQLAKNGKEAAHIIQAYDSLKNVFSHIDFRKNNSLFKSLQRAIIKHMDEFEIKRILGADELNAFHLKSNPGHQRPFQAWTHGFEVATKREERFIRFSEVAAPAGPGKSSPIGGFLVREIDVLDLKNSGLSPEQIGIEIKKRFSLPGDSPLYASDVMVPKGITIHAGRVAGQFDGGEGAMQYVLRDPISQSNFTSNVRSIKDWLNGK